MPLAIWVWTVELLSRTAVKIVDFSLMAQKTARICKTWEFVAAFVGAFVGSVMFVHVLHGIR